MVGQADGRVEQLARMNEMLMGQLRDILARRDSGPRDTSAGKRSPQGDTGTRTAMATEQSLQAQAQAHSDMQRLIVEVSEDRRVILFSPFVCLFIKIKRGTFSRLFCFQACSKGLVHMDTHAYGFRFSSQAEVGVTRLSTRRAERWQRTFGVILKLSSRSLFLRRKFGSKKRRG